MQNPRFDYSTYERNVFATREELALLAKIVLDTDASWFKIAVNAIRILALVGIFWIRWKMHDEELRIGKQIYSRERSEKNEDDLSGDPMDSPARETDGSNSSNP